MFHIHICFSVWFLPTKHCMHRRFFYKASSHNLEASRQCHLRQNCWTLTRSLLWLGAPTWPRQQDHLAREAPAALPESLLFGVPDWATCPTARDLQLVRRALSLQLGSATSSKLQISLHCICYYDPVRHRVGSIDRSKLYHPTNNRARLPDLAVAAGKRACCFSSACQVHPFTKVTG